MPRGSRCARRGEPRRSRCGGPRRRGARAPAAADGGPRRARRGRRAGGGDGAARGARGVGAPRRRRHRARGAHRAGAVDPGVLSVAAARAWIRAAHDEAGSASPGPAVGVELPIVYDGPDLDETARMLGMGPEALAARHAGAAWTVAFGGFAPGFAYLVAPDWPFDVPRLEAPRTRVPPGAVGLAGAFTGAYPRATPGGWRLIGTTGAVLFDPARESPALLRSRHRITWRPGRARSAPAAAPGPAPGAGRGGLRGPRAGAAGDGAGSGASRPRGGRRGRLGCARPAALRLGNRLVGNRETAAGIEITLGGFRARARSDQWIAVTGAASAVTIDGVAVDAQRALLWPAGTELRLGWAQHGARAYAAVRGGIRAPVVAGSRATDRLAGIGCRPSRRATRSRRARMPRAPCRPSTWCRGACRPTPSRSSSPRGRAPTGSPPRAAPALRRILARGCRGRSCRHPARGSPDRAPPRRGAAERADGARRHPGAAVGAAHRPPRRRTGHGRIPGHRGRRRGIPRRRWAGAAWHPPALPACAAAP